MLEDHVSTNCSQVLKCQSVMWARVLEVRPPATSHIGFNRSATLGAQAGNSAQKIATLTYLELLGLPMIPLKTQYRARPPDMSNTAPVLNELAAEQSHNTIPATSATIPRRFSGLAVTMVFTTSGPNLRMSSVSIGPGATQFTRISVSQTSRDRAFVNAITPALAAEYAAKFGNPSLPASEPILTIRPCPARRMSGRIWRVTSNTPTRFTRIARRADICRDIQHCSQEYRREAIACSSPRGLLQFHRPSSHRP